MKTSSIELLRSTLKQKSPDTYQRLVEFASTHNLSISDAIYHAVMEYLEKHSKIMPEMLEIMDRKIKEAKKKALFEMMYQAERDGQEAPSQDLLEKAMNASAILWATEFNLED